MLPPSASSRRSRTAAALRSAGAAAAVAILASACTAAGAGGSAASPDATGTIVLDVHHSKFDASSITVRQGQTVRFIINNRDPIPHELIVGDEEVQDRHERGTDPHHGSLPGEVSVAPGATAETTVTFTKSGKLLFGCHLPGHWDYGMKGTLQVR